MVERLAEGRTFLRRQIAELFAPELRALREAAGADTATRRLANADVAASFESWRLLRDDQRLSRAAAAAAVTEALVTSFTVPIASATRPPRTTKART